MTDTLVLKNAKFTKGLVMPKKGTYLELDQDEMEYVDGGNINIYLSRSSQIAICNKLIQTLNFMSGKWGDFTVGAVLTIVTTVVGTAIGGWIGAIVGCVAGIAGSFVYTFYQEQIRGAYSSAISKLNNYKNSCSDVLLLSVWFFGKNANYYL